MAYQLVSRKFVFAERERFLKWADVDRSLTIVHVCLFYLFHRKTSGCCGCVLRVYSILGNPTLCNVYAKVLSGVF